MTRSEKAQKLYAQYYRKARANLKPCDGRLSGQQLAYAKGVARKRTLAQLDRG